MKPCLDCGAHCNTTRCPACQAAKVRATDLRRGGTSQRGYGSKWQAVSRRILATRPPCWYCGQPATTVDHVVPKAKGGTDDPTNLVPACRPCNSGKGDRG